MVTLKSIKAAGDSRMRVRLPCGAVFWSVYMFVYGACEAGFSRRMGCGLMRCELKGESCG